MLFSFQITFVLIGYTITLATKSSAQILIGMLFVIRGNCEVLVAAPSEAHSRHNALLIYQQGSAEAQRTHQATHTHPHNLTYTIIYAHISHTHMHEHTHTDRHTHTHISEICVCVCMCVCGRVFCHCVLCLGQNSILVCSAFSLCLSTSLSRSLCFSTSLFRSG